MINSFHIVLCPGLEELLEKSTIVRVLPKLTTGALTSVPQSCDHNCAIMFKGKMDTVHYNNKIVMTVKRFPTSKMWCVNTTLKIDTLDTNFKNLMLSAISLPKKKEHIFFM